MTTHYGFTQRDVDHIHICPICRDEIPGFAPGCEDPEYILCYKHLAREFNVINPKAKGAKK